MILITDVETGGRSRSHRCADGNSVWAVRTRRVAMDPDIIQAAASSRDLGFTTLVNL